MRDEALLPNISTPLRTLVLRGDGAVLMSLEGEVESLTLAQARGVAETAPLLLCHGRLTASRL